MAICAPSLSKLLEEINARYPGRDKSSDGGIGDAAHQQRKSDHNVDSKGMYHARDFDNNGALGEETQLVRELLAVTVGEADPRVSYVIWNRRIWQNPRYYKTSGWLPYTGTNPHNKHVHVSVAYNYVAEYDRTPWFDVVVPTKKEEIEMPETDETRGNIFEIRKYMGIMEGHLVAALDRNFDRLIEELKNLKSGE